MPIHVDLITPERQVFSDEVDFIAAPAADGEVGILPHHAPLLARLGIGKLRLVKGNETRTLALSGGFMEVQQGSRVAIFAETAESAEEINAERAHQAAERAKSLLQGGKSLSDIELAEAEGALDRALLRLKIAKVRRMHDSNPSLH